MEAGRRLVPCRALRFGRFPRLVRARCRRHTPPVSFTVSHHPPIKLSSPHTREYWEIPVVHEDADLLAVSKPARLLTSPDRYDPRRPNLMRLLHEGIAEGKPWARDRGLTYLANAHRLDFETTGILLLARNKPALVHVANAFGSEIPHKTYLALVRGTPPEPGFEVDLKLKPDPVRPGRMRWSRDGKRALTRFTLQESFAGSSLLACHPVTGRTHQIRVHLLSRDLPIYADPVYGGDLRLMLSDIKPRYRPKPDQPERPLTPSLMLHAWKLELDHPTTGDRVCIEAPLPREWEVALKYLRQHASIPRRA
jgi:RluA family pseudouridine synthase